MNLDNIIEIKKPVTGDHSLYDSPYMGCPGEKKVGTESRLVVAWGRGAWGNRGLIDKGPETVG